MKEATFKMLDQGFLLEHFVPFRLWLLSARMTKAVGRIYAERFGISAAEWRILAVLGRSGPMTFADLQDRAAIDKVRVSRTITTLMQKSYISREVDPFDRRRIAVALTDSGQAIYNEMVPHILSVERDILASLTSDERSTLGELISKLENKMAAVTPADTDEP
jgi:DNA-binding MarR family transcriptional regulator